MIESITDILNQGLAYIVPMIVLLGLLVFVHELGHFLAAKYYKVKVETFSLGFGPKLFKFIKNETVYCISALPLGGYVKMYGDEPGKDIPLELQKKSYLHKPVGQRIVIALAGPLMNLFFAAVLFMMIAFIGDKAKAPKVGEIAITSAAFQKGFRPYDEIVQIGDEKIETWEEAKKIIEEAPGQSLSFELKRRGELLKIVVEARKSENDNLFSTADQIGKIKGLHSNLHFPVVGVVFNGNMYNAGLRTGDRIAKINGEDVLWYKDIEPTILEDLFNGSGSVSLTINRFEDFRVADSFKEITIDLEPSLFTSQKLDIFVPETVIAEVQKDSPAAKAGLQRLDQILSVNGNQILSFDDIVKNISSYKPGSDPLKIDILRDGQTQSMVSQLESYPLFLWHPKPLFGSPLVLWKASIGLGSKQATGLM